MTPETLRDIRASLGLTQASLASRLGVTLRQIQRWEAGDVPVSRGFAVAIGFLEEIGPE